MLSQCSRLAASPHSFNNVYRLWLSHKKVFASWFGMCALINNNLLLRLLRILAATEQCLNLNFYWFCLCHRAESQVSCFLYANTTSWHSFRVSSAYSLRLSSDWIIWQNVQSHFGAMSLQGWCDGIDVQSMCSRLPAKSIAHCSMYQWVANQSRSQELPLNVHFFRNSSRHQHDDDTKRGARAAQWGSDLWALSVVGATRWVWTSVSPRRKIKDFLKNVSRLEFSSSGWVNQLVLKNGFSNFPSLRYLITSPEWNFAFWNSIKIRHRKVRRRWSGRTKRWRANKQLPWARG